jgi:hypothetical protein
LGKIKKLELEKQTLLENNKALENDTIKQREQIQSLQSNINAIQLELVAKARNFTYIFGLILYLE